MRGKHGRWKICSRWMRITPAGAGKTTKLRQEVLAALDHPRRCGENGIPRNQGHLRAGSPPQVRGKLPQFVILPEQVGITPAGAGKTSARTERRRLHRDHPRRCGENYEAIIETKADGGSPPQVRGKLSARKCYRRAERITPAGAGKTGTHAGCRPRGVGSPPQVRGKLKHSATEIPHC